MGILSYIKIGGVAVAIIVVGYFIMEYQHRGNVIATQQALIEEQQGAIDYYEGHPAVDKTTQEVNDEIKKAVDAGDIERVRSLYQRLREHKRAGKGAPPPEASDGGNDE